MMANRSLLWITTLALSLAPLCLNGDADAETITLVDGATIDGEVLFVHPNAPRLVVRSPKNASLQSLPLALVHQAEVNGQSKTFNPKRELTADELAALEANATWAEDVGDGQIGNYARERWDKAPAIIWRYPGEDGNGLIAESWLDERGQVLEASPWETDASVDNRGRKQPEQGRFEGDVLLPAADTQYMVLQPGNRDHLGEFELRHLTVENNAEYRIRYTILGNLWMKHGSKLGGGTQTGELGSRALDKHTIARFDNYSVEDRPKGVAEEHAWAYAPDISHWVSVETGENGSLEVVGLSGGPSDRIALLSNSTLIISEDSYLGNGNRGAFFAQAGTTAVLLNGARVGAPDPISGGSGGNKMGTYGINGRLLFGTPDHPLTRDLVFSACYYLPNRVSADASVGQRANGASFILGDSGEMIVHSADPKTARVIFRPRDRVLPFEQYSLPRELWGRKEEDQVSLWDIGHEAVPTGVAAVFRGRTDFNGVVFDGFYEGGILVDPAAARRWKNVSFGDANHAEPEKLFKPLDQ